MALFYLSADRITSAVPGLLVASRSQQWEKGLKGPPRVAAACKSDMDGLKRSSWRSYGSCTLVPGLMRCNLLALEALAVACTSQDECSTAPLVMAS